MPRATYDCFVSPEGAGRGGPVRVTDISGEQLVADALPIRPKVLQSTAVQFARH